MYQELQRTCTAKALFINSFVQSVTFPLPLSLWFHKLLKVKPCSRSYYLDGDPLKYPVMSVL